MTSANDKPILEFSAGGVVLKDGTVLLIRARDLKGRPVWTFPKGKLNEGEKSQQAALREVAEETGWRCRIEAELPKSQYWFQRAGRRVKKTVRWFRMIPLEQIGQPDQEVDEVAWLPLADAPARLTYEADRKLLKTATAPSNP
jgi:ADP-ribose pyrophosphatase YjhB (NUDIX family)